MRCVGRFVKEWEDNLIRITAYNHRSNFVCIYNWQKMLEERGGLLLGAQYETIVTAISIKCPLSIMYHPSGSLTSDNKVKGVDQWKAIRVTLCLQSAEAAKICW